MRGHVFGLAGLLVAVQFLQAAPTSGQPIVLEKIADQETSIPDGPGTFAWLGLPAIRGSVVVFPGAGNPGPGWLYMSADGQLTSLFDRATPVPGGSGTFENGHVLSVALGDGEAVFESWNPSGLYRHSQGSLVTITESSSSDWFGSDYPNYSIDGGEVAFVREGLDTGVFLWSESGIHAVVDAFTPAPGGTTNFGGFARPRLSGGRIVFLAWASPRRGVYSATLGGQATLVVDSFTPVPGGAGVYYEFRGLAVDGPDTAFTSQVLRGNDTDYGAYMAGDAPVTLIVDSSMERPDGAGPFGVIDEVSLSAGRIAFRDSRGIYVSAGGLVTKIFDLDDRPEGKRPVWLRMGPQALDDNRLVFVVHFDDGSSAIYLATLPPTTTCSTTLVAQPDGLEMRFQLASPEPLTWNFWLQYQTQMFRLWSVPIPAIETPFETGLWVPGLFDAGTIGFLSTFVTDPEGIGCADWDTVDTGVSATAAPLAGEVRDLLGRGETLDP